jgi:CheY-like chemotaxis protein
MATADTISCERMHCRATSPPPGCKLLVAEDAVTSRRLLRCMIERIGGKNLVAQTCFAATGREAVDAFLASEETVELVILDMHMPVLDGVGAMKAIRDAQRQRPGSRACPVLALSADVFTEQRERALAQGFSDYLTKPISLAQLTALLQKHELVTPVAAAGAIPSV